MPLHIERTSALLKATAEGSITAAELLVLCEEIVRGAPRALVDCRRVRKTPEFSSLSIARLDLAASGRRIAVVCVNPMVFGSIRMVAALYLQESELQIFRTEAEASEWLSPPAVPEVSLVPAAAPAQVGDGAGSAWQIRLGRIQKKSEELRAESLRLRADSAQIRLHAGWVLHEIGTLLAVCRRSAALRNGALQPFDENPRIPPGLN
jgi:hypothetical protein